MRFAIIPKTQKIKNTNISTATIAAPTGASNIIDRNIPVSAQITDTIAEQTVTDLKLLNTRIADSAGNITSAEIKSEPTSFIPTTIITAIITAIKSF